MVRTKAEYLRAKQRLDNDSAYLDQLKEAFSRADLTAQELKRAMQPALSFHKHLVEEVEGYERTHHGQV